MKKNILLLLVSASFTISASAQVRMRDIFAQLPDSVLPFMTLNNRLDCIDFIENNIEARVKNRFDQHVTLDSLTSDYLCLHTSTSSYVEMKLVLQPSDTIICVNRTYMGTTPDSEVRLYSMDWTLLSRMPRPQVSEYLHSPSTDSITAEAAADTMRMIRQQAEYLPLMKASLSPSSNDITWTLQTAEFPREQKRVAAKYLHPVVRKIERTCKQK